jgi:hypothetical protein
MTRKANEGARGTHELESVEGKTCYETKRRGAREVRESATHELESAEGETNQVTERKQMEQGNSLPGEYSGRNKSEGGKKARGRAKGTHFLESAEGGTSQGAQRKRASERHSPTAERRGWERS